MASLVPLSHPYHPWHVRRPDTTNDHAVYSCPRPDCGGSVLPSVGYCILCGREPKHA